MKLPAILPPGVRVSWDFSEFCNIVEVLGAEPKKGQKRVRWVETADRRSDFNPEKMAHNGAPRRYVETVETEIRPAAMRTKKTGTRKKGDDKPFHKKRVPIHSSLVKRKKHAKEIGKRVLRKRHRGVQVVEVDILPQPHLEPADVVVLKTENGRIETDLDRFSLPLTSTAAETIGDNRKVRLISRRRKDK